MSETANPYSAEARGAAQVAAEAQQLSAAYTSGLQGIESQTAHAQNQQLIAELLHRQAVRTRTGSTYLTPVQTRVEVPATPTREPDPAPHESPMRVVLHGAVVESAPVAGPPDPGLLQRQQEQDARDNNMAASRKRSYVDAEGRTRYYTPDDRRRQQQTENAYAAREQWRREQGQDYIPTREEWLRGQYTPTGKEQ